MFNFFYIVRMNFAISIAHSCKESITKCILVLNFDYLISIQYCIG